MMWKIVSVIKRLIEIAFVLSFVAFVAAPSGGDLKVKLALLFSSFAVLWLGVFAAEKKWKYSEELHYGKSVMDTLPDSDDD